MVTAEEYLKFYIDKDTAKNSLSFQLTSISGKLTKLKDKENLQLFFDKNRRKKKKNKRLNQ